MSDLSFNVSVPIWRGSPLKMEFYSFQFFNLPKPSMTFRDEANSGWIYQEKEESINKHSSCKQRIDHPFSEGQLKIRPYASWVATHFRKYISPMITWLKSNFWKWKISVSFNNNQSPLLT